MQKKSATRGARALVVERDVEHASKLRVKDTRYAMAVIANVSVYRYPSHQMKVIVLPDLPARCHHDLIYSDRAIEELKTGPTAGRSV